MLKSPQRIKYKRNSQNIKPVVIEPTADTEVSTESRGDTLQPAPIPELTNKCPQETAPTGVPVAGTLCCSGRVSQPQ